MRSATGATRQSPPNRRPGGKLARWRPPRASCTVESPPPSFFLFPPPPLPSLSPPPRQPPVAPPVDADLGRLHTPVPRRAQKKSADPAARGKNKYSPGSTQTQPSRSRIADGAYLRTARMGSCGGLDSLARPLVFVARTRCGPGRVGKSKSRAPEFSARPQRGNVATTAICT